MTILCNDPQPLARLVRFWRLDPRYFAAPTLRVAEPGPDVKGRRAMTVSRRRSIKRLDHRSHSAEPPGQVDPGHRLRHEYGIEYWMDKPALTWLPFAELVPPSPNWYPVKPVIASGCKKLIERSPNPLAKVIPGWVKRRWLPLRFLSPVEPKFCSTWIDSTNSCGESADYGTSRIAAAR